MPDNKKDGKSSLLKRLSGSKGKNKVDIPTIIFFSILIVGAIVITIIIMQKPHSKIYSKAFGDNIETLVEVYNNGEIDIAVSIDDDRTLQQGTYKAIGEQPKDTYNGTYEATFKTDTDEIIKINMTINDDTLIFEYDDGTKIEFKGRK